MHIDEENNSPGDVEPVDVLFDIFSVPVSLKVLETIIQKFKARGNEGTRRELTLTRKRKDIDAIQRKSKRCYIPYL